ncbi:MAG: redoxin family protein [Pseudomonadota bacterium]
MKRAAAIIPLTLLLGFAVLGAANLIDPSKPAPGLSDGRDAPTRVFDRLGGGEISFNPPPEGETIVVNLFASWCGPCEAEHPLLTDLSARAPGRVYGVLYDDTVENGRDFLARLGDPFTAIAHDPDGQGGLDFGLTGVPETFVVDAEGRIIRHIRGVLTPETTDELAALVE